MRKGAVVAVLTALTIMLGTQSGFTQPTEDLKGLKKDVEALKEGQAAIQKNLQEIKSLLQARPTAAAPAPAPAAAPQGVVLSLDGAPVKGEKSAKVTMVDFTDYQ